MSSRQKKNKRSLSHRCILCHRKAVEGLACPRHRRAKVDMKYSVTPFVVLENDAVIK